MSVHIVTAAEKIALRSNGQHSKLYLAVINPEVVFAAQVNGTPLSDDEVSTIPYNSVSFGGSGSAIVSGMTGWIGTTPGAYDRGQVRIKGITASGSTAGTLSIAPTSEITWVDGLYVTVVDEFGLWPRQGKFEGGVYLCDDDVIYSNQHAPTLQKPVPIMGPDLVLEILASGSQNYAQSVFTATESWVLGSTITGYAWTITNPTSGSSAITAAASGSTAITFYTPGTYRVGLTVTSATGVTSTGYRVVYVWNEANPPMTQFKVESVNGDWQEGGWSFDVIAYAQADRSAIRDRARVILYSQDTFSGSQPYRTLPQGTDGVVCAGWINGETISWSPDVSSVTFEVRGPQFWLDKISSWPAPIVNVTGTPANWNEYQGFKYDAFLWHEITWRSTAAVVMDIFQSGDDRNVQGSTAPWGTIWSQLTQVAENQYLLHPCCNRLGQLFVQKDTNYLTTTERAAVPVVMGIEKVDWEEPLDFERRVLNDVGFVDCVCSAHAGPFVEYAPFRAGAWGTALGRFGRRENRTELMVKYQGDRALEQAATNEQAGILLGYFNNDYPRITIELAENNRYFDVCPHQYGTLSVAASDTPRGITLVDKKIVVKSVTFSWDEETGSLRTSLTAEGQSNVEHGFYLPIYTGPVSGTLPLIPLNPWVVRLPKIKPPFSPNTACTGLAGLVNGPYPLFVSATVQTAGGGVTYVDKQYHCKIRGASSTNKTRVLIGLTAYEGASGSAPTWTPVSATNPITVFALDSSGSPILQAVSDAHTGSATGQRSYTFSSVPAAATEVFGFRFQATMGNTEVILKTFDFSQDTAGWVPTINAPVYQYTSGSGGDLRIGLTGPVPAGSFGTPSSSAILVGPVFDVPLLTSSLTRIRVYSHYGQFTPGDVNMSYQLYYYWDPATPSPGYNYEFIAAYAPGFRTDDLNGTSRIDTFIPLYTGIYLNKLSFESNWASQGSGYLGTSGTYGALDKVEILNAGVVTNTKSVIDSAALTNICQYYDP